MAPKVVADVKMKNMAHIYTISDLLFLIGKFEVASLEKHVNSANPVKGNRRRSIGYCPYLWKSPLQAFQPAQQSH